MTDRNPNLFFPNRLWVVDTLVRSNMCPQPGCLRPKPGPIDGSFSVDTGDGGRFFQENHGFPTSSCSFLRFSRFVDLGFTGWSVHSISVRLIRYKSLVVIEQAGHSVASVVTATNPLPTHIQPSPVEMEHVSTSPDIAKSGFARGILVQRSKMAIFG
jgi:hypothetical protein